MNKKGQSAIEFVVLIGFVLFFFVTFLYAVQVNISDKKQEEKNFFIREVALTVQNELALAESAVDGYYREFDVPLTILGSDYAIEIIDGMFLFLKTIDGKYAISLPVIDVQGNIQIGENVILKKNGVVCVNVDINDCAG